MKNIIVVMEWVPSKKSLVEKQQVDGGTFSKEQEMSLKKAFELADASNTGGLNESELKEVLRAVDVDVDGEEGSKFVSDFFTRVADKNHDGTISFEELKNMVASGAYYKVQDGRYYGALSLVEAECMRAFMHNEVAPQVSMGGGGVGWAGDTSCRLLAGATALDSTIGFEKAGSYQSGVSRAVYKFIDSQVNFEAREVNDLIRALQGNDVEVRKRFFDEVRSNRRRKKQGVETSPVAKVFITPDEYHLLQHRVTMRRIRSALKEKGMFIKDFFDACDADRDGMLNQGELFGGMEYLGLKVRWSGGGDEATARSWECDNHAAFIATLF